jgi:hypothetical protein
MFNGKDSQNLGRNDTIVELSKRSFKINSDRNDSLDEYEFKFFQDKVVTPNTDTKNDLCDEDVMKRLGSESINFDFDDEDNIQ